MVGLDVTFPAEDSRCEGCGYALRGLDISGNCPECGLAIAESSPTKRVGLPWQQRGTIKNWLLTNWMVLTRPRRAFRVMRLETGIEEGFVPIQLFGISLFAAGWVVCVVMMNEMDSLATIGEAAIALAGLALGIFVLLSILTGMEIMGIWWFSRIKKTSMSWRRACQLCGYAAAGWLWLPFFWTAVGIVAPMQMDFWDRVADSMLGLWLVLLLLTCGSVIWFETLVWIGIRQVRFGNAGLEVPRETASGVSPGGAGG